MINFICNCQVCINFQDGSIHCYVISAHNPRNLFWDSRVEVHHVWKLHLLVDSCLVDPGVRIGSEYPRVLTVASHYVGRVNWVGMCLFANGVGAVLL